MSLPPTTPRLLTWHAMFLLFCNSDYFFIFVKNNSINMAKPIRNTPVLFGEDAKQFLAEISMLPSADEREKERARIQDSVQEFLQLISKKKATTSK